MRKNQYTIGLDLGGTKLNAALVDHKGKIVQQQRYLLVNDYHARSPKQSIANIVDRLAEACVFVSKGYAKRQIVGVGLASAGPINAETGKLVHPANYPGWGIVSLKQKLETALKKRRFARSVAFQNDAMAAALGEGWSGRASGLQNYMMVTVGTGIGTGTIFHGKPTQFRGMGGEWGHQIVAIDRYRKGKGHNGFYPATLEGIASGTGIITRARKELGFKGDSVQDLLLHMRALSERKRAGYLHLFDDGAVALAALCFNTTVGLNVERIFFTGGMMHVKRLFFAETKRVYRQMCLANKTKPVLLQESKLGNNAGVIGAARLVHLQS